jgi:hypothetical protein
MDREILMCNQWGIPLLNKRRERFEMKKVFISIFTATALTAFAYVVPSGFGLRAGSTARDQSDVSRTSSPESYSLKGLLLQEVKDVQGNTVGVINDFLLDPNRHVFAVIYDKNTGKTIAIPAEAFSSMEDHRLVLNLSRDQLASAPEFDMAFMANPAWGLDLYREYGIQPSFSDQGKTGQPGSSPDGQMGGPPDQSFQLPGQQQGARHGGQSGSRSY